MKEETFWKKAQVADSDTQRYDFQPEADDETGYYDKMSHNMRALTTSYGHGGDIGTLLQMLKKSNTDYVTTLFFPEEEALTKDIARCEYKDLLHRSAHWKKLKLEGRLTTEDKCTVAIPQPHPKRNIVCHLVITNVRAIVS